MVFARKNREDYPQYDFIKYVTEQSICYALEKGGLRNKKDFELHKKIDNIPFNKNQKHEVDFVLKSHNGEELYVEIKGQMTYLEVNKLRYLQDESNCYFYILQLTEIDWIEPFNKEKHKTKFLKSKIDFELQIDELIGFVEGKFSGKELTKRSKKRLNDYIKYRNKDLKRWRTSI